MNDAPAPQTICRIDGGRPFTLAAPGVLANDVDPDGDALQALLVIEPMNGTLTLNPDGSLTYVPNTVPAPGGEPGVDFFVYQASDGVAGGMAAVTLIIHPGNGVPTLSVTQASVTTVEGGTVGNTGRWLDPDGDAVQLTASVGQVIPDADGTWRWEYRAGDGPAQSEVTIEARDENGGSARVSFLLQVENAPPQPTAPQLTVEPGADGTRVTAQVQFADPGVLDTHTAVWHWGDGTTPPAAWWRTARAACPAVTPTPPRAMPSGGHHRQRRRHRRPKRQ